MLKSIILVAISAFLSLTVFAQSKITGVVKDSISGEPIPFAKVKVEGHNNGANTDFDGVYTIKAIPGKYVLVFSMANEGYEDVKIDIEPIQVNQLN